MLHQLPWLPMIGIIRSGQREKLHARILDEDGELLMRSNAATVTLGVEGACERDEGNYITSHACGKEQHVEPRRLRQLSARARGTTTKAKEDLQSH